MTSCVNVLRKSIIINKREDENRVQTEHRVKRLEMRYLHAKEAQILNICNAQSARRDDDDLSIRLGDLRQHVSCR